MKMKLREWQRTVDEKSKKFILLNCCNRFMKLHVFLSLFFSLFLFFLLSRGYLASRENIAKRNKHIRINDAIMELSNFSEIILNNMRGEFFFLELAELIQIA